MELAEKVRIGIDQAIVSRGKKRGMLKAKCPPMDTYGAAVWQALQFYSNHYKMGMGHMIFMSKECREVYDYVKSAGKVVDLSSFDADGNVLRKLNLM